MKLTIIITFLGVFFSFSQKNIKIEYEIVINTDRNEAIKRTEYLYVNGEKNKTFYTERLDSSENKKNINVEDEDGENKIKLVLSSGVAGFNYLDYTENQIITREDIFGKSYLIKEEIPVFEWKLHNDTKTLDNVVLNKATCYFRGRNYTAWYSIETPIEYGPWKFHGLPGLIYEIYDDSHQYIWFLKKVAFIEDEFKFSEIINKKDVFITTKEYVELKYEKFDPDIEKKLKAITPRGATMIKNKVPRSGLEIKFEWEE